jgi:hypothetical protein
MTQAFSMLLNRLLLIKKTRRCQTETLEAKPAHLTVKTYLKIKNLELVSQKYWSICVGKFSD